MYYVRCNTRSSGASAKGTPGQALDYITDAHDAERDPTYSHAELTYIARLDPGWKADLEGGRIPLVGLGGLRACDDQAALARGFEAACQPYHDRRGSTGYLSYTFTMPKELSLVAEGHPQKSREAMYAAVQRALDLAFDGMDYKAVTTVHTRNEAGEVHYHAHVLIGKFASSQKNGRTYSLNSRSGGNTGKLRLKALKQGWKDALDVEVRERLGVVVQQGVPYGRPALTLRDGTYVPPLNRESRRLLDKHLSVRVSEPGPGGSIKTRNFRWTNMDHAIYELAAGKRGQGWSREAFCDHFPKLASRLKSYEARVATLKRIGYLTADGHVSEAFTIHFRAHTGDHPELQRLRIELHRAKKAKSGMGGPQQGGGGAAGGGSRGSADSAGWPRGDEGRPPLRTPVLELTDAVVGHGPVLEQSQTSHELATSEKSAASAARGDRREDTPTPPADSPDEVELWLALHRHQQLAKRLERLGVTPDDFRRILQEARKQQPTPETLARLRDEATRTVREQRHPASGALPRTKPIIRSYCRAENAKLVSYFVIAKGLLTLNLGEQLALAERIRTRARFDYFYAKQRRMAVAARRLQPLFWIGRLISPDGVARLESALKHCNKLATRQQAAGLYRQQVRRAYRNSREDLLQRLRVETREAAVARRPDLVTEQERLQKRLEASRGAVPSAMDAFSVEQLRRGIDGLALVAKEQHELLKGWKTRESELLERLVTSVRAGEALSAELAAALRAGRAGYLLSKERECESRAQVLQVPAGLGAVGLELRRADARLRASGAPNPFTAELLSGASVATVRECLAVVRGSRLLDEGTAWAFRTESTYGAAKKARELVLAEQRARAVSAPKRERDESEVER
jgi:hypothetical protein